MKSKVLPPTYFTVILVLLVGVHFLFPIARAVSTPYNYIGLVLAAFGIIITVWADHLFKQKKTTVKPHEIPTALVTSGPFSISRHPMYLGMAAILFGSAVLLGSVAALAFPFTFIIFMELKFIPHEERNMSEKFGSEYEKYKKRVRRWI
ncbi:isoprenylcysteine carboxylmethyltransferase family protein [Candidatus Woesearchaeota archaeon]|nr:isoprenylcysteine carboxylmethyltransferase family protein [Candidatus Woesearchaeota archaeon]